MRYPQSDGRSRLSHLSLRGLYSDYSPQDHRIHHARQHPGLGASAVVWVFFVSIVWDLKEVPAEVLEEGRRGTAAATPAQSKLSSTFIACERSAASAKALPASR